MALVSTSPSPLPPFPRVAISHLDGQAKAIHHRKLQLHSLQRELIKAKDEIISAVKSDTDQTTSEVEFEFLLVLSELRLHYDSLDPEVEIVSKRQIEAGNDHPERRVPTRISYIVPSTHTMLYSVLSPLCAAIAAGSCSILELPQTIRSLTEILRRILVSSLDADTFALSDERPQADFLQTCNLVAAPAAKNSSDSHRLPAASSPMRVLAVVDRTANINDAAFDIVHARFSRHGGSPYAPDIVLVNEFVLEQFLTCVLKHATRYMANVNGSPGGHSSPMKLRNVAAGSTRILDDAEKSEEMRVIVRGSGASVISVQNRQAPLLKKQISEPILVVHAISSLDDAIDFASHPTEDMWAAAYVFSAPAMANYLVNFINPHVSYINHIPAELLVGPVAPLLPISSPSPRFTQSMFQDPRPQFVTKTSLSKIADEQLREPSATRIQALQLFLESPLPSMKRKEGQDMGFFVQALISGLTIVSISLSAGLFVTVKYGLKYLRSR